MKNLLEEFNAAVALRKLIAPGGRVLVAVSGGLDSMVLLHLLHEFAGPNRWTLFVAHFNHQLRGRASGADERFVARTATALGLRCELGCGRVKQFGAEHGVSLEMAARDLRHKFLANAAHRLKCKTIALAHHADDQVELFLLRLLRGAGGEGLSGMSWISPSPAKKSIQLIRPLLGVRRADLARFARENQINFREDATNAAAEFLRNRIRHELLPLMRRRFQAGVDETLLRTMEIIRGQSEAVEALATRWLAERRPAFAGLPVAVQRSALKLQLRQLKVVEEFDLIEGLRIASRKYFSISPGKSVARDEQGRVAIQTSGRAGFLATTSPIAIQGRAGRGGLAGLRIDWELSSQAGVRFQPQPGCEQFDAERIGRRVVLRHWRPGDRFQPIGMRASLKLQDWFTNLKIGRDARRQLVVACTTRGEVFWVEGQRIGERFKLQPDTIQRLIWRWRRG